MLETISSPKIGLNKKSKRNYGKIDDKVLVKAIVSGKTYTEAGKLAGSRAKDNQSVKEGVYKKISRNPTIKRDLIKQLEEKRDIMINALDEDRITKAPVGTINLMICQIIDKIQLLRGDPTQIMRELKPMVIREVEIEDKPENEGIITKIGAKDTNKGQINIKATPTRPAEALKTNDEPVRPLNKSK